MSLYVQWVLDLAAKDPFIVKMVGNLPVGTKQFAGHLERFAANRRFRGVRIRDWKLEGTLDNKTFVGEARRGSGSTRTKTCGPKSRPGKRRSPP